MHNAAVFRRKTISILPDMRFSPIPGTDCVIQFVVATPSPHPGASIRIYSIAGKEVAAQAIRLSGPGTHSVTWKGTDDSRRGIAPGTYLCRLVINGLAIK
ncbi:MAG: hypothetical protein JW913_16055 [Chitinispirillaceae bacterium]|nr:hypothetical protein [Chitinispirillaceae bacterium]